MFGFNAYSSLLLIGVVQGLVYAALLLARARREDRLSDLLAALILLVGSLYAAQWMLGFAGWYNQGEARSTFMFYVEWSHLLALGPLVWLYFRAVTNTDFRWRREFGWHFAPVLLFALPVAVATVYDWIVHAGILGRAFAGFGGSRGPAMDYVHETLGDLGSVEDVLVRVQLPVYLVLTIRRYREFRDYVRREFSNARELDLSPLRNLLWVLLVGIVLAFASDLVAFARGVEDYADVWYRYFFISVMVFAAAILFYGLDLRRTGALRFTASQAVVRPEGPTAVAKTRPTPAPDAETARWAGELERRLAEHRDYLEPDLKLANLAARVGTNASVLSRAINASHGVNFNDYVNGLRCEAFLARIRAGEHERHTLLSLALDSGFASKSTFNRAFRKRFGYAPGEAAGRHSSAA